MKEPVFNESVPWAVDFPPPEAHVGPIFYRERNHAIEFCFEIRGGKGVPFAVIRPDRFLVLIPEYVLQRLVEALRSKWPEPLRVEFPQGNPSVAYLFTESERSKEANIARWIANFCAAPHPLSGWSCIGVGTYWDGPRDFLLYADSEAYLFDQPFDEELDDYASRYEVYRVPLELAESAERSWDELRAKGTRLSDLPKDFVQFRSEEVPGYSRVWYVRLQMILSALNAPAAGGHDHH
jgi:hypothetical protein